MMSTVSGTVTTLRRCCTSPREGGDSTVKLMVPVARPWNAAPSATTRTVTARKPLQGHSMSLAASCGERQGKRSREWT